MTRRPHLTFFVELADEALERLFATGGVLDFLAAGGHGVAMGMLDLGTARARVVRELEAAGVPVTAWLLLDVEWGYWLNADNAEAARRRYHETVAWAEREGLRLHRVGLDVEFPRTDADLLMRAPRRGLWTLLRRRRGREHVGAAERSYAELVDEIRRGGRRVETYHLPQLLDERAAGSTLLRRTLGLVDVPADAEVFMLYSSYFGAANCRAYYDEAPCIALGVTGGGVHADDPAEVARRIGWEQLAHELRAAARASEELYVFSLEGCVERGMIDRLASFEWSESAPPVEDEGLERARRRRRLFHRVLRAERVLDLLLPGGRRG